MARRPTGGQAPNPFTRATAVGGTRTKSGPVVTGSTVKPGNPGATLVSIAVTPASATIGGNVTEQYTAIGTYSDLSTQNITGTVQWTSSIPSVATIAAGGLATGVAPGTTTIKATDSLSGVNGSTGLTVSNVGLSTAIVLSTIGDSILSGNTFAQSQYACSRQICAALGPYWALGPILADPGASLSTGSGASQIVLQWTTGISGGQNSPSGENCTVAGMPNVIFMDGGGNDVIVFGRTQAQAGADFGTTAQTVTSYLSGISAGGSGIGHILVVMTPTGRLDGSLTTLASLIRTNYASWAASGVRVILADAALDPNIGQGANTASSYYVDGVHLSQTGVAILAGIVNAALTAAGIVAQVNAAAPARLVDAVNTAPGLFGRYRLDLALVANSGTVLWTDISGNGNHLVRPPIVVRPGFSNAIAGYNGKGVATFSGTQDMLYSVQWAAPYGADRNNGVQVLTLAPPYTVYVIGNITTSAANASMYGFSPSNYIWGDGGTPSKYNFVPAGGSIASTVSVGTTPHIFCISVSAGGAVGYIDSSASPVGSVTAAQATSVDLILGAISDSGGQNPSLAMTGNIAGLIICQGFAHAASDVHAVFAAEASFYGQSWS